MDRGAMAMKVYSALLKASDLPEPHLQIIECHIKDTCWRGLTPLQRSSRCILQSQPTEQVRTFFKCQTVLFDPYRGPYQVLPLRVWKYLVARKRYSIFPRPPVRLFNCSLVGSYPSAETQSVYSIVGFCECILCHLDNKTCKCYPEQSLLKENPKKLGKEKRWVKDSWTNGDFLHLFPPISSCMLLLRKNSFKKRYFLHFDCVFHLFILFYFFFLFLLNDISAN